MTEQEIETAILEMFEQNYEMLQADGGHSLTQDTKKAALQQVLMYWRKMRHVAEKVTQTEVKLTLPEQQTPKGRKYSIHGIVDIVQEDEQTIMYDIKTHDAEYVANNLGDYEKQLNIYAYIWQNLRGQPLDQTAIIATAYPKEVKKALNEEDNIALAEALEAWEPVVNIPFNPQHVQDMIADFSEIVDAIEDRNFIPPPVNRLNQKYRVRGRETRFATQICNNCDGRFSCSSYRAYSMANDESEVRFKRYFREFESTDQEEWLRANLEAESEA